MELYEYNDYIFNYLEDYEIGWQFVSDKCFYYVMEAFYIKSKYENEIRHHMTTFKVFYESEIFLGEGLLDKKRNKQLKQNDIFSEINHIRDHYLNWIKMPLKGK